MRKAAAGLAQGLVGHAWTRKRSRRTQRQPSRLRRSDPGQEVGVMLGSGPPRWPAGSSTCRTTCPSPGGRSQDHDEGFQRRIRPWPSAVGPIGAVQDSSTPSPRIARRGSSRKCGGCSIVPVQFEADRGGQLAMEGCRGSAFGVEPNKSPVRVGVVDTRAQARASRRSRSSSANFHTMPQYHPGTLLAQQLQVGERRQRTAPEREHSRVNKPGW